MTYLSILGAHVEGKLPHNELGEQLFAHRCYHHVPVLPHPPLWPVLVTLDHSVLHRVRHHDDDVDILLPDHSPEVYGCVWQRALGCYVLILVIITLHRR